MSPNRFETVERIFHEAKQLQPSERPGFLDQGCGDDKDLRAEVESLLAHAGADSLHIRPIPGDPQENLGTKIGRYKLLQQIGEGGFALAISIPPRSETKLWNRSRYRRAARVRPSTPSRNRALPLVTRVRDNLLGMSSKHDAGNAAILARIGGAQNCHCVVPYCWLPVDAPP